MAAAQRTASRCTLETARATHAFEIDGYSLHKARGQGKFVRSAVFAVGGYDWRIKCYPSGNTTQDSADHIAVYLELMTSNAEVSACADFSLVNQATRLPFSVRSWKKPMVFTAETPIGYTKFMKRSKLEASPYLRDDRLVIECEVAFIKEPVVVETAAASQIVQDPPSDLLHCLAKLLEGKKGADVIFKVKGEVFHAHKAVLAMRSPVFDAEFYGSVGDKGMQDITIEDMQPAVFKALLRFIYTDSLPSLTDLDDDADREEMAKHLLVAADRYALDSMKRICENILCRSLNVETVAAKLALADQHHCSRLKDACFEFILSSNRMGDVVASQGYVHLKRSCPDVVLDVFERATKSRNI